MKRTLLEIACGLATLVLMVSFHHQLARVAQRDRDVDQLAKRVEAALARVDAEPDLRDIREQLLSDMEERLRGLETRLAAAAAGSEAAARLEEQIAETRKEAARLREEFALDVQRTRSLVDAYVGELRSKERDADLRLSEQQNAIANLASAVLRDPGELTRTMLAPTVQLNGDDTVGSGTLVFSELNPKTDKVESYVLTAYHVVRNILADTPKANHEGIDVTIYVGKGKKKVKGRMVASNPRIDAALVRLETEERFPNVARAIPEKDAKKVKVWDPVCAVGCPLGNDPVPSHGEVSSLSNELGGSNYWMINAPTYFGNSGGGVYMADTKQLIGIFSKIYTHGKGASVVVPHMGLCVPIASVYEWLEQEGLSFVLRGEQVPRIDMSNLSAPPPAPMR